MERTSTRIRLSELMAKYSLSQNDISKATGIPKSAISMYINGYRIPRQDKLSLIADAYSVDPAWLMGYDVPMLKGTAAPDVPVYVDGTMELIQLFGKATPEQREATLNLLRSFVGS